MTYQQENVFLVIDDEGIKGMIAKDPKTREVVIYKVLKVTVPEDAVKILNHE